MAEGSDAMELVVKVAGFGLAGGVLVFLLRALLGPWEWDTSPRSNPPFLRHPFRQKAGGKQSKMPQTPRVTTLGKAWLCPQSL